MITLTKGEVRQIGIEVSSTSMQNFVIDSADAKLKHLDGSDVLKEIDVTYSDGVVKKSVVDTLTAVIDGHKIKTLFSAQEIGQFYILILYRIGPEIMRKKIIIEVVD